MQHSENKILERLLLEVTQIQQQQIQMQQQHMEDRTVLKEIQKQLSTSPIKLQTKSTLSYQLAKDVSSIVGLKEAITWKSKFQKCIWTIAVLAGVIATAYFVFASWKEYMSNPTATRVEMVSEASYPYPLILLCPNVWLDTDKALSLGLSLEGLKYSLGYVNKFQDKIGPSNSAIAKQEFINFFNSGNFASFDDYLEKISQDIPLEPSKAKYDDTFYTSAYCPRCNDSFLPKVVTSSGVCYNFRMQAESGRKRLSSVPRQIGMQLANRSRGLIATSLWSLYLAELEELALKNPVVPRVIIKSFTYTGVRYHKRQFYFESKAESRCLSEKEKPKKNYTSTICITECLSPLYSAVLGCTPLESTVGEFKNHPSQLCNTFEKANWVGFRDWIESKMNEVSNSEEAKKCYKECLYTCDRDRYEMTQEGEHNDKDDNFASDAIEKALAADVTFVDVFIENSALYQGGILTLWEIDTISFIELISNVGGTLGLFVGCTMMTFVQILLFIVKYFSDKEKKVERNDIASNGNTK